MALVVNEVYAAARLSRVLDRVSIGREDVMIERADGEPVVVVALEDYLALHDALAEALAALESRPEPPRPVGRWATVHSLESHRRRRAQG